jgi:hypothetical protein
MLDSPGGRRCRSAPGRYPESQLLELIGYGGHFSRLYGRILSALTTEPSSDFFQTLI